MNLLSISRYKYEFTFCFANTLSISRKYNEFTITFAISLWIYYIFHEFTIHFAEIPWIHYLIRRFTMNPLFTPEFTMDPLFFPEFTMNSLSVSRIHNVFATLRYYHVIDIDFVIVWMTHMSQKIFMYYENHYVIITA